MFKVPHLEAKFVFMLSLRTLKLGLDCVLVNMVIPVNNPQPYEQPMKQNYVTLQYRRLEQHNNSIVTACTATVSNWYNYSK